MTAKLPLNQSAGASHFADLLYCAAGVSDTQLAKFAQALGFEYEPMAQKECKHAKEQSAPNDSEAAESVARQKTQPQQYQSLKPAPAKAQPLYFAKKAFQRRLEAKQLDFQAEPLPDTDLHEQPMTLPVPHSELMPWPRLWPALKSHLSWRARMATLDQQTLVDKLSRLEPITTLPRLTAKKWADECHVLLDFSPLLSLFWHDQQVLLERILQLRGSFGLHRYDFFEGDPEGPVERFLGKQTTVLDSYPLPTKPVPILIVSDVGALQTSHSQWRAKAWAQLCERLQEEGCSVLVVNPIEPAFWSRGLSGIAQIHWDIEGHGKPEQVTNAEAERKAAETAQSEQVEQLIAWLSPLPHISGPVLRSSCKALGNNASVEARFWNHPAIQNDDLDAAIRPSALEHYAQQYACLSRSNKPTADHLLNVWNTLFAWLSPLLQTEFQLKALQPLGADIQPQLKRFVRLAKAYAQTEGHAQSTMGKELQRYMLDFVERSHASLWQYDELLEALVATNQKKILSGELALPAAVDVVSLAAALKRHGAKEQHYQLVQTGQALKLQALEGGSQSAWQPQPIIAEITALSPTVSVRTSNVRHAYMNNRGYGEEQRYAIGDAIPLGAATISLVTDSEELHLTSYPAEQRLGRDSHGLFQVVRGTTQKYYIEHDLSADELDPEWASSTGQDQHGQWADLELNNITQRFRWIEPGEFLMGSPKSEAERFSNETQHRVELTEGYWLADTACTQAFWEMVMGENPSNFKGAGRPVENVSYKDVKAFIQTARERFGLEFKLPTEAQWEYACRAGTSTPFSFGEQITPEQANYDGSRPYNNGEKGLDRNKTVDVKALPANQWGLYQMHGNVWEWCSDWYGDNEAASQQPLQNPIGAADGRNRVCRGGSWIYVGRNLRSARRNDWPPDDRYSDLGFRLALGQAPVQRPAEQAPAKSHSESPAAGQAQRSRLTSWWRRGRD